MQRGDADPFDRGAVLGGRVADVFVEAPAGMAVGDTLHVRGVSVTVRNSRKRDSTWSASWSASNSNASRDLVSSAILALIADSAIWIR